MDYTPKNIHLFNLVCLTLFAKLYDAFPSLIDIDPNSIGADAVNQQATEEKTWDSMTISHDAILWLAEEGFIRIGGGTDLAGKFYQVRLSLKGLTLLGYIPTSLQQNEPKEPVINKVKKVLSSGAEKAGTESVKSIISEMFKLALNVSSIALSGGISSL